jgi:hypothetical protein
MRQSIPVAQSSGAAQGEQKVEAAGAGASQRWVSRLHAPGQWLVSIAVHS